MTKFFKATNDQMFKAIFTSKKNKNLLKKLIIVSLNNVLNINLNNLKILSSEIPKTNIHIKGKTVDILAETKNNILNIELNSNYYPTLHRRNAAYIFSKYAEETKVSEGYYKVKTFIQINYTKGLGKKQRAYEIYTLKNKHNDKEYIDNLIIIEYNIDKIKDTWYSENRKLALIAALDAEKEELNKICKGDEYMELFKKEVKRLNENQKFTAFMTNEEEEEKLKNTLAFHAKEEGERIGERKKGLKVAKKMLERQMKLQDIAEITGLSMKTLENLK